MKFIEPVCCTNAKKNNNGVRCWVHTKLPEGVLESRLALEESRLVGDGVLLACSLEDSSKSSLSLSALLNMDNSESPSMPSQFSALWIAIKSWISCASVLPTMPPLPLLGPNTVWLYKGSLITGNPERDVFAGQTLLTLPLIEHRYPDSFWEKWKQDACNWKAILP